MEKIIYKANTRGKANFGWLRANYSFSFANYYNPDRIHFGMLRVLNDDEIDGGMGFSPHPHNDMEIITIPLEGKLAHKDSTGGVGEIKAGEVQVMSAGTGVTHSEYNGSHNELLRLFQIWIFPKQHHVQPRYDQKKFEESGRINKFQLVVSNDGRNDSLMIHQDAFLSLGNFEKGTNISYSNFKNENGVFLMVIDGKINIDAEVLTKRDAIGITNSEKIDINIVEDSQLLIIEVPLR